MKAADTNLFLYAANAASEHHTAGAAAGIALALHGGARADVIAGASEGVVAGALTGIKVERGGASEGTATNFAALGLSAGALFGIYAGASGASWATIPLAVPGGVGGAAMGRLCSADGPNQR